VQPEPVAAGLVTTDDRGVGGQGEARLGPRDLALEGVEVAGPDGAEPRRLAVADREGERPLGPAVVEGQVQPDAVVGRLLLAGRGHEEPPVVVWYSSTDAYPTPARTS
jgi:hypothetical protein